MAQHSMSYQPKPAPKSVEQSVEHRIVKGESARRVRRVISTLLRRKPFFGTLALSLVHAEDHSRKTIASDGKVLAYNPEWVKRSSADKIETAIARICLSLALKHHTRRGEREYGRWQTACQAVTLAMLKDEDFAMPSGEDGDDDGAMHWVELAKDKSAESVYQLIPPGKPNQDPDGDGQGQGQCQGQAQGQGPKSQGQGQGQGQNQGRQPPSSDPTGTGETMDSPDSGNEDKRREEEQRWDNAAHQADRIAKAEGRSPGEISEMLEESHKRRMSWRETLRRFMQESAKNDYTWTRPNRRFIDSGLYLPSAHSEAMPPVVFAIDTSGSVAGEMLSEFWSELRGIVEEVTPTKVWVIQCDAQVSDVAEYDPTDLPAELVVKGRGGTMFSPVWDAVEEHAIDPCCLIYFSDMYCSDFGDQPPYPVMWADWLGTVESGEWFAEVPFGEVLDLSEAMEEVTA